MRKVKPKPEKLVQVGGRMVPAGGPAATPGRLTRSAVAAAYGRAKPTDKKLTLVGGAGIPVGQQRGSMVVGGGGGDGGGPLISMGGMGALEVSRVSWLSVIAGAAIGAMVSKKSRRLSGAAFGAAVGAALPALRRPAPLSGFGDYAAIIGAEEGHLNLVGESF